jgi:hypothetical protein
MPPTGCLGRSRWSPLRRRNRARGAAAGVGAGHSCRCVLTHLWVGQQERGDHRGESVRSCQNGRWPRSGKIPSWAPGMRSASRFALRGLTTVSAAPCVHQQQPEMPPQFRQDRRPPEAVCRRTRRGPPPRRPHRSTAAGRRTWTRLQSIRSTRVSAAAGTPRLRARDRPHMLSPAQPQDLVPDGVQCPVLPQGPPASARSRLW